MIITPLLQEVQNGLTRTQQTNSTIEKSKR